MKRYNVVSSDRRIGTEMHADSDGRFVLYSDHLAAIEQARREVKEECAMIADRRTLQTNLEIAAAIRARKP